jgi:hypothetical protein
VLVRLDGKQARFSVVAVMSCTIVSSVPSRSDINHAAKCLLRLPLSIGLICTATGKSCKSCKSFWYIRYISVVLAYLYVLSTRGAVANKYPAGVNFTVAFGIYHENGGSFQFPFQ